MDYQRIIKILIAGLLFFTTYSCSTGPDDHKQSEKKQNTAKQKISFNGKQIISPYNGSEFTIGDTINIKTELTKIPLFT